MRSVYGCLGNFPESLSTPTATFPEIFNRLLFRLILWMCIQNLKSVLRSFTRSWDNSDWSFANPQSWGSGMVPFERALVSSYRPSIVTVPVSLRVSEILPLLCSSTWLFPTPPLVSPKFPNVPLGYIEQRLIVHGISVQDFQPMCSWSTNVTDRRTTCNCKTAFCTTVHRMVKINTHYLSKLIRWWSKPPALPRPLGCFRCLPAPVKPVNLTFMHRKWNKFSSTKCYCNGNYVS